MERRQADGRKHLTYWHVCERQLVKFTLLMKAMPCQLLKGYSRLYPNEIHDFAWKMPTIGVQMGTDPSMDHYYPLSRANASSKSHTLIQTRLHKFLWYLLETTMGVNFKTISSFSSIGSHEKLHFATISVAMKSTLWFPAQAFLWAGLERTTSWFDIQIGI